MSFYFKKIPTIIKVPKMINLIKMKPNVNPKIVNVNPKIVNVNPKLSPIIDTKIDKIIDTRFEKVPKCINCKYNVIPDEIPICTKFKYVSVMTDYGNFNYYMDSITCREDTDLCGPNGDYFEVK